MKGLRLGMGFKAPNRHVFTLPSAEFDGSDYIDLPFTLQYTTSILLEAEILTSTASAIVIDGRDAANDGPLLQIAGGGEIFARFNSSAQTVFGPVVTDGTWHTLSVVGDAGTFELVVDGVSQGTDTLPAVNVTTNGRIGARSFTSPTAFFTGSMRNIRIDLDE